MKKWLKIWVVALAMFATVATLASTGNVRAEEEPSTSSWNIVKVIIGQYNSGQNTCTWSDYIYNFTASTETQSGTETHRIWCIFWDSSATPVTLQLTWDLLLSGDETQTIPSTNVLLTNGTWYQNPEKVLNTAGGNTTLSDVTFTTQQTLYYKAENAIGDARSNDVSIKVIVDAWQQDGTYNGTLVLTYAG